MTRQYARWLRTLNAVQRCEWHLWYGERPEEIKGLIQRVPPGSEFVIEGVPHYVVSYHAGEAGRLYYGVSVIHPADDYELAHKNKQYLCAGHV